VTAPPASGFLPSADGFAFPNAWPSAPAVTIATPLGSIGIGNAANGLCGGMVCAALDYWNAGRRPPQAQPPPGSPGYRYLVRRQVDSWNLPGGVIRYYRWMTLPDAGAGPLGLFRPGTRWRTITRQWPLVRASLDDGIPAPLGLVTVASANPALLPRNHQALAYRYSVAGTVVTIGVYDPNSGPDDDVMIWFDAAGPDTAGGFSHNLGIALPVRGFFLTAYTPAAPPAG